MYIYIYMYMYMHIYTHIETANNYNILNTYDFVFVGHMFPPLDIPADQIATVDT